MRLQEWLNHIFVMDATMVYDDEFFVENIDEK
jgi:hypothetical protein